MLRLALMSFVLVPTMALAGDGDGDGVDDATDNCVGLANADQADTNADGYGDACVDPSASVHASATVGGAVTVGANTVVPASATLSAGSTVGANLTLGAGTVLGPRSSVAGPASGSTVLGDGLVTGRRASIGATPTLGANTTIGRATSVGTDFTTLGSATTGYADLIGNSVTLGDGVVIANLVTLGDNTTIGAGSRVGRDSTVSGSVGSNSNVGGGVTITSATVGDDAKVRSNSTIASGATVGNGARVGRNVTIEAGADIGANAVLRAGTIVRANATVDALAETERGEEVVNASIHGSVSFTPASNTSGGCSYGAKHSYQYTDLGSMPWKQCMAEISKRGAMAASQHPSYLPTGTYGWNTHRTGNNAMYDQWASFQSAGITTSRSCIAGLDPDGSYSGGELVNTVDYDGDTWAYQDLGSMYYDQCSTAAGNAGASIITPGTIGLGTGDGYWVHSVLMCNTYEYISSGGNAYTYENLGGNQRSGQHSCMVGYMVSEPAP